jgi:hypothetical protein
MSSTLFLVMPAGNGVMVVKTAVLGMFASSCDVSRSCPDVCFKKSPVDAINVYAGVKLEKWKEECLDNKAAREDVLVSQAIRGYSSHVC